MVVENGGWRLNIRIFIVYKYDILTLKFKETFCRRAYANKNKGSQAPPPKYIIFCYQPLLI